MKATATGGTILAIDPGNIQSGYVVVRHDGKRIVEVLARGKVDNNDLFGLIDTCFCDGTEMAIEMVASYGMAVGAEVFDTCVWIGRFIQAAQGMPIKQIYRREEKLYLCGQLTAKDSNIRQAIVDRFAPGEPNYGKGTKKKPGFFYGFSADVWAAMAVACTYFDKYIRGIEI